MVQHTARGSAQTSGFTPGRGLLLVILAAAIGVLLLARAVEPDRSVSVATGESTGTTAPAGKDGGTTATSAAPATTVTTIPPARPPAEVTVIVFNARGVQGAAAANKDELMAKGFNTLSPETYPAPAPATNVFFAEGYQADALNVATALSISANAVAPFPATGVPDVKGAKVAVVLGTDGQGLKPS